MIGILTMAMIAATPCEGLHAVQLPNATITKAEFVAEGVFKPVPPPGPPRPPAAAPAPADPNAKPPEPVIAPAHCRIVVELKPSRDSLINMELWLPPADKWNGKFEAVGNGGWAGYIQGMGGAPGATPPMVTALRAGYATSGNDTGHQQGNGEFTLAHPEKTIDFAYRAMHEMVLKSKTLITAFYSQGPRLSYYNGCSTGGRQGLMEAQRYPEDFDGIIAGAPANDHIGLHAGDMARMVDIFKDPEGLITKAKQELLAKSVMNACDTLDGVKDNIITNPVSCTFDPAVLQCKSGDGADCLNAKQVSTAKRLYAAAKNSKGELVFPGYSYGGESAYNVMRGVTALGNVSEDTSAYPVPGDLQLGTYRYLAHQDPIWDWKTFNIDTDPALAKKNGGIINSTDPDMSKFKAHGGKLILYHGWADPAIQPEHTVDYYSSVLDKMGNGQDNWMRLFMVPGMGHCSGGAGPNQIDWMAALEGWREKGSVPDFIIGKGTLAEKPMTRPVCSYPQNSAYKGSGDINDAANFVCK